MGILAWSIKLSCRDRATFYPLFRKQFSGLSSHILSCHWRHYGGIVPALIHSEGRIGRALFAMNESLGPKLSTLAVAILTGQQGIELRNPRHLQAMFLAANPESIDTTAVKAANDAEMDRVVAKAREAAGAEARLVIAL